MVSRPVAASASNPRGVQNINNPAFSQHTKLVKQLWSSGKGKSIGSTQEGQSRRHSKVKCLCTVELCGGLAQASSSLSSSVIFVKYSVNIKHNSIFFLKTWHLKDFLDFAKYLFSKCWTWLISNHNHRHVLWNIYKEQKHVLTFKQL